MNNLETAEILHEMQTINLLRPEQELKKNKKKSVGHLSSMDYEFYKFKELGLW